MTRAQQQVAEFMRATGEPIGGDEILPAVPTIPSSKRMQLCRRLVMEEAGEVNAAGFDIGLTMDLPGLAKELADVVYVALYTANACGIDLEPVFDAVHTSNMSKMGDDGQAIRDAGGKILKGDNYRPADIAAVLRAQMSTAESTAEGGE